ncbi:hypothetical protein L208DRAFT_1389225, partial [Tricholoma matsutake]
MCYGLLLFSHVMWLRALSYARGFARRCGHKKAPDIIGPELLSPNSLKLADYVRKTTKCRGLMESDQQKGVSEVCRSLRHENMIAIQKPSLFGQKREHVAYI